QPADEDALLAEQVRGAPAEEKEAGEGDRVGVDDPGQVLLAEVERRANRRQRDVHDGNVEDDHELADARERERQPQRTAADLLRQAAAPSGRASPSARRASSERSLSWRSDNSWTYAATT